MIYLDTHVVAWLYGGHHELIPQRPRELIEASDLLISPIVRLELQYLYETGRAGTPAGLVVQALAREIGLQACDAAFADVIELAAEETWTRDPFDRVIVAQARLRGAPLLTKDRTIHANYGQATWDSSAGS